MNNQNYSYMIDKNYLILNIEINDVKTTTMIY